MHGTWRITQSKFLSLSRGEKADVKNNNKKKKKGKVVGVHPVELFSSAIDSIRRIFSVSKEKISSSREDWAAAANKNTDHLRYPDVSVLGGSTILSMPPTLYIPPRFTLIAQIPFDLDLAKSSRGKIPLAVAWEIRSSVTTTVVGAFSRVTNHSCMTE